MCVYCHDLMENSLWEGPGEFPMGAMMIINGLSVCGLLEHVNAARYSVPEPNYADESIQQETGRVKSKRLYENRRRQAG